MKNVYKTLNNVQTHLITWGNPFNCDGRDVIVCITGNPGVPDFYIEFASTLHSSTGLPICVIGQAGHEHVPHKESNILKNQEHLFDLEGQVKHKLDLINAIDKASKLHLVGHSIGAWMITEMVERDSSLQKRILSINLLFPTLQRMAETQSGILLNKLVRRLHILVMLLFTFLYYMPTVIKTFLIGLYLKFHSLPSHYIDRIMKYLNPRVGEKVLFLAYDEMDRVRDLNVQALTKMKHQTYVTYGVRDGWAPVSYMDDLKQFQPEMHLHEVHIDHSFVLRSSEQVAEIVSKFIKTSFNK